MNADGDGATGDGATAGVKGCSGLVLPALEEMVSRHFPIEDSREPQEGSEEATTFAQLLGGLLSAFAR